MSVADVTTRIAEIQNHLASIHARFDPVTAHATGQVGGPVGSAAARGTTSTSAAEFRQALQEATGTLGLSGTGTGSVAGEAVVDKAMKYLGVPYVWGGTHPEKGLDCSGLVQLVYSELGHDLPRVSHQQAAAGRPVASLAEAQPGDILAWDNSSRNGNGIDHVAIYVGDGKMIEAPRTGLDVRITEVSKTPDVIRRIVPDGGSTASAESRALVGTSSGASLSPTGLAASGTGGSPYGALFASAGAAHGVSPKLLAAVAQQESGFNPRAVSPAGAQGLMQLMPATAKSLGVTDSFDPVQSVNGAAKLLSSLLDRFGSTELALAAYNAGPGAVIRHDGVPPYAETQNYVRSITSTLGASR